MDFESGEYPAYPGSDKEALKVDLSALVESASRISVAVTFSSGGSYFSPSKRLINIDTKTPTKRGFVSLGHLTDEYLHAWNQITGRGKHLTGEAAKTHKRRGGAAARRRVLARGAGSSRPKT